MSCVKPSLIPLLSRRSRQRRPHTYRHTRRRPVHLQHLSRQVRHWPQVWRHWCEQRRQLHDDVIPCGDHECPDLCQRVRQLYLQRYSSLRWQCHLHLCCRQHWHRVVLCLLWLGCGCPRWDLVRGTRMSGFGQILFKKSQNRGLFRSKLVRLVPNRTNPGLFQIKFLWILARQAKIHWNLILKVPDLSHFGDNLTQC